MKSLISVGSILLIIISLITLSARYMQTNAAQIHEQLQAVSELIKAEDFEQAFLSLEKAKEKYQGEKTILYILFDYNMLFEIDADFEALTVRIQQNQLAEAEIAAARLILQIDRLIQSDSAKLSNIL